MFYAKIIAIKVKEYLRIMKFSADGITLSHEQSWYLNGSTQAQEYGYDEAAHLFINTAAAIRRDWLEKLFMDEKPLSEDLPVDEKTIALTGTYRTLSDALNLALPAELSQGLPGNHNNIEIWNI